MTTRVGDASAGRPQDPTDGGRIGFDDGGALGRPSVTEPVVTVRAEGDTPEAMGRIRDDVLAVVRVASA